MSSKGILTIDIFPPTVNHYIRAGIKRYGFRTIPYVYKTSRAKEWIDYVAILIHEQKLFRKFLDKEVKIKIEVFYSKSNIDIDNLLKCILDALVAGEVITDDNVKYVKSCQIVAKKRVEKGKEKIVVYIIDL